MVRTRSMHGTAPNSLSPVERPTRPRAPERPSNARPVHLLVVMTLATLIALIAVVQQGSLQQQPQSALVGGATDESILLMGGGGGATILPPVEQRPRVRVNIREFARLIGDDLRLVAERMSCTRELERNFERDSQTYTFQPAEALTSMLAQLNNLTSQHRAAVSAIVAEAERLAAGHTFNKSLKVNYTDVHRLRSSSADSPAGSDASDQQDSYTLGIGGSGGGGSQWPQGYSSPYGTVQFTSIGGGTPVPGPPEWQTPFKNLSMQVNPNFGDIPVNTSQSAVHLPLTIYAGSPKIMNGIAWTERLDGVFRRNLAQYAHVHHQYYGHHLGFLRTFPAHRWRIPRSEPDLFDARMRPWYVTGASTPKDIVILVDSSGSMTGSRREIAKGVVFEILDTLTINDHFAVLRFSETVTPVGLPKCQLNKPRQVPQLEAQCPLSLSRIEMEKREWNECHNYRRQYETRGQYLRDHPRNESFYMTDEAYRKSIVNVTEDIRDAYLLPASSRNIRYLKSNFSMPTAGIANFTHGLMAAFELLQSYNRTNELGSQCNQAIMLITDGAIRTHEEVFNRYNYPGAPIRVFSYMIGREVGDISHAKAMACLNRGYYAHVINLSEVREQVQKYLAVMARPLVISQRHPISWTNAYGDETHQVLTDWVLEIKRRERARIMLQEERERMNDANSSDVINIELTNIPEYDELPLVDEQLKDRIICENAMDDLVGMDQSLQDELDPLGYADLACHWAGRRADLLTSVVEPVFDLRNTSIFFERKLSKNVWTEHETRVRNAQLLGVAAVDLRIAEMIRAAPSHMLGPNGYSILMGQNGFIMHHPDFRALLEDPFDKQSRILKPYFSAVDLTHIEQVYHKNASDLLRSRAEDNKLIKLREAAIRGGPMLGNETMQVKRAVDCRRRPQIRTQLFYYGPVKGTPFSFMLALPGNYGLNRLSAKLPLDAKTHAYLTPSPFDLWTIHPDYKYCEQVAGPTANSGATTTTTESGAQHQRLSLETLIKLSREASSSSSANNNDDLLGGHLNYNIQYDDLSSILGPQMRPAASQDRRASGGERFICDKDLFQSLLFDARATHEASGSNCGSPCDSASPISASSSFTRQSSGASRHRGYSADDDQDSCAANAKAPDEMRSKLAQIHGVEMSFVATRSGLTRTRVFDLSPRVEKLGKLFIERHNKAVDEAWYARTVDWNMRFQEEATIVSVPANAYVRLIAKLRQRITQRYPAANDTRSNCDPQLDEAYEEEQQQLQGAANSSVSSSPPPPSQAATGESAEGRGLQNDEPDKTTTNGAKSGQHESTMDTLNEQQVGEEAAAATTNNQQQGPPVVEAPKINYNEYSSYDFLDLLANSSVHISATQTVIAKRSSKQRTPVAVTGHLYDYASFARRFLNSTSLQIDTLTVPSGANTGRNSINQAQQVKVDICPGGECPTRCGLRNDTIDCLLVDNNGFIVVGEELPHIGRSLVDYDDRLMASLVERRVFFQVNLTDYQAICARNDQADMMRQTASGGQPMPSPAAPTPVTPAASSSVRGPAAGAGLLPGWDLARSFVANVAAASLWTLATLYSALFIQSVLHERPLGGDFPPDGDSLLAPGHLFQWQRSVGDNGGDGGHHLGVGAQSAIANQSLLALLPNKTYLRPCERTLTLYETRPVTSDPSRPAPSTESPEYYVTRCGCSGWYVHEWVPKSNLLMLIVNTTSACRRCEQPYVAPGSVADLNPAGTPAAAAPSAPSPFDASNMPLMAPGCCGLAPNKTTEDSVCAMLERDSQLYTQRPTLCMTSHPEEASIHICGAASKVAPPHFFAHLLIVLLVALSKVLL